MECENRIYLQLAAGLQFECNFPSARKVFIYSVSLCIDARE
jgi:hypothetical protein